jgi:DNA primase
MIGQATIQKIIDTAQIVEVVEDFVQLKRRGSNYVGLCPFHNEKTASFMVSPGKNIFKCFGCNRGGGTIQFIMEHEKYSFPESLRYLASKYNIEIEESYSDESYKAEELEKESLFIITDFAKKFYEDQMHLSEEGKNVALTYFKERGFLLSTIKKFGLGYMPDQRDLVTKTAIEKGYNIELLKTLGLTTKYDTDFFRNRVMFPIFNISGKVIAFAGRTLQTGPKIPKYINSSESKIYLKSKVLFGMNFARHDIRRKDQCIIVEGYTDLISLHQAGMENVVASSGTALTTDQIRLIKRYSPNTLLMYDGDSAGISAAIRGADLILEEGMNADILFLPENEDPDSFMKKSGFASFTEYLEKNKQDYIRYRIDQIINEGKNDPAKTSAGLKVLIESVAKIPDTIRRSLYVREITSAFNLEERVIITELNNAIRQHIRKKRLEDRRAGIQHEHQLLKEVTDQNVTQPQDLGIVDAKVKERDIIRILVSFGDKQMDEKELVCDYIFETLDSVSSMEEGVLHSIYEEFKEMHADGKTPDSSYFINHSDEKISFTVIGMLTDPYEYSSNWNERWGITLQTQKMPEDNFIEDTRQAVLRYKLEKLILMTRENKAAINNYQSDGDNEKIVLHLKIQQKLKTQIGELAEKLGTIVTYS